MKTPRVPRKTSAALPAPRFEVLGYDEGGRLRRRGYAGSQVRGDELGKSWVDSEAVATYVARPYPATKADR